MNRYILLIIFFFLSSCSRKISPYFNSNKYFKDGYSHVENEEIAFKHYTFGDIDFNTNSKEVVRIAKSKKLKLNNVWAYGKSNIEPYYEYFILLNPRRIKNLDAYNVFRHDTIVSENKIIFVGISLDQHSPKKDFDKIFHNVN